MSNGLPWMEHAQTIVRERCRFTQAVLEAFGRMNQATQAAWAALASMAVDAAVEQIDREKGWPEDPHECELTVQVVATQIAERWLDEAEEALALEDLVGTPPPVQGCLHDAETEICKDAQLNREDSAR